MNRLPYSLSECTDSVAALLKHWCKDLDPCTLEDLITTVNGRVIRSYQLGVREGMQIAKDDAKG